MGDRRKARELALQALFSIDIDPSDEPQDFRLESFCNENKDELSEEVKPFFMDLVQGVLSSQEQIDHLIEKSSKNWKINRMPTVDRNIMRLAVFEFLKRDDIPPNVSINEAVEIGKKYGTRDSGAFINGVLDRIRSLEGL